MKFDSVSARSLGALVALWTSAVVLAAPATATTSIQVRLGRVGGLTSVAQGEPFPFKVTAINPNSGAQTISLVIVLQDPTPATKDIVSWQTTVPGDGRVSHQFTEVAAQWFEATGSFQLSAELGGVPTGNTLSYSVTASRVTVPLFQDVTSAVGLSTVLPRDLDTNHANGAAWGDVNQDGHLDLYVPIRDQPAQLWIFQPSSGTFAEEAAAWGVTNPGATGVSAVFADYDNDGDPDLYLVTNNAFNNDGGPGPQITWYQPDHLFHNEGDGSFSDVTCDSLPTEDPNAGFCSDPTMGGSTGSGFEAVWLDFDQDGDQDLYLAQDYFFELVHKDVNRLYRNDGFDPKTGHWKFVDLCAVEPSRAECLQINSMGVGVGDFDNDLLPDVAISNMGVSGGNVLLRWTGSAFVDVSGSTRVARPVQDALHTATTWGLGFYDMNLDGYQDLFVGAGSNQDTPTQPNQLFVGTSSGAFLDLSAPSHSDDPGVGHGVAFADYDRDGLVDIYVVNAAGSPILYRNVTATTGHWLEVQLVGSISNRDGCGARIALTKGGVTRVGWVFCGSSLGAGSDRVVHFGGVRTGPFTLEIDWPSGVHQTYTGTGADRLVTVTEPG